MALRIDATRQRHEPCVDGGTFRGRDHVTTLAFAEVRERPYIKVHVSLPSGVSVVVLMSKGDLEALKVEPGDPVAVDVVDAKVFVQSYSI